MILSVDSRRTKSLNPNKEGKILECSLEGNRAKLAKLVSIDDCLLFFIFFNHFLPPLDPKKKMYRYRICQLNVALVILGDSQKANYLIK